VDKTIANRIGVRGVRGHEGHVSQVKRNIITISKKFTEAVSETPKEFPSWLEEICSAAPGIVEKAKVVLGQHRTFINQINQNPTFQRLDQRERNIIVRNDANKRFADFIQTYEDVSTSATHLAALTLWYATLTVPAGKRGSEKINDQPIWGGATANLVIDACVWFGIGWDLQLIYRNSEDDFGTLQRVKTVRHLGERNWELTCRKCGETYQIRGIKALDDYYENGHNCPDCR